MPISFTDYLRDLATRLRKVPVCHGVDGHDIDTLREVSMGIAELEKASVAYVDANTNLISENKALRQKLFPYADATEISGISWDGKYLLGDKASIKFFHEMKNRGEQIDVYKRAYDQNLAAKDAEITALKAELTKANRDMDSYREHGDRKSEELVSVRRSLSNRAAGHIRDLVDWLREDEDNASLLIASLTPEQFEAARAALKEKADA